MIPSCGRWSFVLVLALLAPFVSAGDAPVAADDGMVVCPACNGEGVAKCEAKGCIHGKVPCPGECIRSSATWEKHKDPNHADIDLWTKVWTKSGQGVVWFPKTAIGHALEWDQNGVPRDGGPCKQCKGTGLVECPVCHGTGRAPCSLCGGNKKVSKIIADAWIAKRDEERAGRAILMNDGTTIYGKVISRMPDRVMIKTDEGKMVEVKPEDIKSEPPPEPKKKPEPKR